MAFVGRVLTFVGFVWFLIGLFSVGKFLSKPVGGTLPLEWDDLGLLLTFLIYLGPGLLIGGLGVIFLVVGRKRKKRPREVEVRENKVREEEQEEEEKEEAAEERGVKKCPRCTKEVQVGAKICRFCRYDFREPSLQTLQAKVIKLRGKYIQLLREFRDSKDPAEKASLRREIDQINDEIENLRKQIVRE